MSAVQPTDNLIGSVGQILASRTKGASSVSVPAATLEDLLVTVRELKELVETLAAMRGDGRKSAVTIQDLINIGLLEDD